jgi:hypothetical protein
MDSPPATWSGPGGVFSTNCGDSFGHARQAVSRLCAISSSAATVISNFYVELVVAAGYQHFDALNWASVTADIRQRFL